MPPQLAACCGNITLACRTQFSLMENERPLLLNVIRGKINQGQASSNKCQLVPFSIYGLTDVLGI